MRRGPRPAKSKEAKPPAARKSPKDDGARVRDLEKRLAEALRDKAEAQEQQAATAEILRVISSSPTDTQPVFDAIVRSAVVLYDAFFSMVGVSDGEFVHLRAMHKVPEEWANQAKAVYPLPLSSELGTAKVTREQRVLHILDLQKDALDDAGRQRARTAGYRTWLGVPLLGPGGAIGVLAVARREKAAFTDKQIALLQTFADQAVIAIENVRLFNETKEALDRQTATSEILRVISRSPTDLQPVLDAVAERSASLCGASDGGIFRVDGDCLRLVAHHASIPSGPVGQFTLPLIRGTVGGRAVLERRSIHVTDLQQDVEEFPEGSTTARRFGHRTILGVPLLREGVGIGCIIIRRTEAHPFTQKQVELLQAFADQAVIAIENARLFKELEARNNELRSSLEQQTATSELLKVIGRSTFDLQPVFNALAENAVRFCEAERAFIFRVDGQLLRGVASYNASPEVIAFIERNPATPGRGSATGRAALERRTVHIHDALADPEYSYGSRDVDRFRTIVGIPMLKAAELLGVITIYRHDVRPFSDSQIALMETFADQAAIAIENARLLSELRERTGELTRSVDELTALGEVSRALSSTLDLDTVLATIVARAIQLSGTDAGTIWEYEPTAEQF